MSNLITNYENMKKWTHYKAMTESGIKQINTHFDNT